MQRLSAVATRVANGTAGPTARAPDPRRRLDRARRAGRAPARGRRGRRRARAHPGAAAARPRGPRGRAGATPPTFRPPGALLRCALGARGRRATASRPSPRAPSASRRSSPAPEAHVRVEVDGPGRSSATRVTAARSPLAELYERPRGRDRRRPAAVAAVAVTSRAPWRSHASLGDRVHAGRRPGRPAAAGAARCTPREPLTPLALRLLTLALCASEPRVQHARRGRRDRRDRGRPRSTPRASPRR